MKAFTALAFILCLAGCLPAEEGTAQMPDMADCGASDLGHLTGQPAKAAPAPTAMRPVRVLAPNSVVTLDHNPQRLNVHTGMQGKIISLSCG